MKHCKQRRAIRSKVRAPRDDSAAATDKKLAKPDILPNGITRKFDRQLPVSEVFYSIEGEGILTGFPTVFIRTFGCNFTCSGFSNPDAQAQESFPIESLDDFKPLARGCDSVYAWGEQYSNLRLKMDCDTLVEKILDLVPSRTWVVGRTKPVLSITGGEPTLHQKFWEQFLYHPFMDRVNKLLIETNGSVPLSDSFIAALNDWRKRAKGGVMWANSPKLSVSGEPWAKAIRPNVILKQRQASDFQYFKFVSDGSSESVAEVEEAMFEYGRVLKIAGHPPIDESMVLLMPMGARLEQQQEAHQRVARACLDYGYVFCARTHVYVYGNTVGT